jgi:hypothetical protein
MKFRSERSDRWPRSKNDALIPFYRQINRALKKVNRAPVHSG